MLKWSQMIKVFLLVLFLVGFFGVKAHALTANNGRMDLTDWHFSEQGNVSLDGKWAFYWDTLLAPGTFSGHEPTGYYALPSFWINDQQLGLPSFGHGTYRLVVKTDGEARLYGLKTPDIYTEYVIWINGTLLEANGSFANNPPGYLHPKTHIFYNAEPDIEIVLQIKNHAHVYGGVAQHIRLGTMGQIQREHSQEAALDLILIAICLFAGIYYLILYFFKKGNKEFICFFLLCLAVAIRNLLSNTTLIMKVYPDLPFWIGSRIVTLSIPLIVVLILFYTRRLFQNEIPRQVFRLVLAFNMLYALIVIFAHSGIYSRIFPLYLLTIGPACAMVIYLTVRAVINRKREATFMLAGILILMLGALIDTLVYLQVIVMNYVLSLTLVGFIVLHVVLLARRYTEAFQQAEQLSRKLKLSLDKLNNTETAFMNAQMKPHFLFNTLTAIAEKCESDPTTAGELILMLSKYLRHALDYDHLSGMVPVERELELVRAYTSIERTRFTNIEVVFDLPEPLPVLRLPPLTLQPLVENAIKHGLRKKREGGRVMVRVKLENGVAVFLVKDDGVGMADGYLDKLCVLPSGSSSIGLYNINTRLSRLLGKGLKISSEKGVGTSVSFEIPI